MENIIMVCIGILFIILGIAIDKFKCYWLISGYNTASREEQEKVDIKKLAKVIAKMCYGIAIFILISAFIEPYFPELTSYGGLILPILILGTIMYCQRFDNNKKTKGEKLGMAIILAVPLFISIIVLAGATERNKVVVKKDKVSVDVFSGITINTNEIKNVTIVDTIPKVEKKNNGSVLGNYKKGTFTFVNGEKVYLYLEGKVGPYLKIDSDRGNIYLNFNEVGKTKAIYSEIRAIV